MRKARWRGPGWPGALSVDAIVGAVRGGCDGAFLALHGASTSGWVVGGSLADDARLAAEAT
jgi:hypothetical protein